MQWFLVLVGLSSWVFAAALLLLSIAGLGGDTRLIAAGVMALHGTVAFIGLAVLNRMSAISQAR